MAGQVINKESEGQVRFRNYYEHEDCEVQPGVQWEDDAECTCSDRCPACNIELTPFKSADLDENGEVVE